MVDGAPHAYDVVIIGAGIGGLVCGCYLAKAGMKVLMLEQHSKPGGYCTSFSRQGFVFDAAAHSFGGYRQDGIVRKVFTDLGIDKRINITRTDPSDIIITPDHRVTFWSDAERTVADLQGAFPDERENIRKLFHFLIKPDQKFYFHIRNWTFKDLLDNYFRNEEIKSILAYPLYGNGALPPSRMSALIGAKIFQEFLLDGGYYPGGKMQDLADALAHRFNEFGGELRLSNSVQRIRLVGNRVEGVIIKNDGFIPSKLVVSNCDARQTFIDLLGKTETNEEFFNTLEKMVPSLSIFVLYLGVKRDFRCLPEPGVNFWLLSHYDLDELYELREELDIDSACIMVRTMPNHGSLLAFVNVPYKSKQYWDTNKQKFMEAFIKTIERMLIPGLSDNIIYQGAATPHTLYRYTLNFKGAAYGWECTPAQVGLRDFRKPSFIQDLYMTGHWATQGLGIPGVVYAGHDTAKSIIRKVRSLKRNNVLN